MGPTTTTKIQREVFCYDMLPAKSLQLCPTLCDPMDHSPPGSSVHGILQARILQWVAMPSSRGSSNPGIKPSYLLSPALAGWFFTTSATWEACVYIYVCTHPWKGMNLNLNQMRWMNLEPVTQWSELEKNKYCINAYVWNQKMVLMNLHAG